MFGWNKIIDKREFLETIDNESALLDTVIELFTQQASDSLSHMQTALANKDCNAFERAAHDLKNIGRNIASDKFIKHSRELEILAGENKLDQAAAKIDSTQKLIAKAKKELENIRKSL